MRYVVVLMFTVGVSSAAPRPPPKAGSAKTAARAKPALGFPFGLTPTTTLESQQGSGKLGACDEKETSAGGVFCDAAKESFLISDGTFQTESAGLQFARVDSELRLGSVIVRKHTDCEHLQGTLQAAQSMLQTKYDLSNATVRSDPDFETLPCADFPEHGDVPKSTLTSGDFRVVLSGSFLRSDTFVVLLEFQHAPTMDLLAEREAKASPKAPIRFPFGFTPDSAEAELRGSGAAARCLDPRGATHSCWTTSPDYGLEFAAFKTTMTSFDFVANNGSSTLSQVSLAADGLSCEMAQYARESVFALVRKKYDVTGAHFNHGPHYRSEKCATLAVATDNAYVATAGDWELRIVSFRLKDGITVSLNIAYLPTRRHALDLDRADENAAANTALDKL